MGGLNDDGLKCCVIALLCVVPISGDQGGVLLLPPGADRVDSRVVAAPLPVSWLLRSVELPPRADSPLRRARTEILLSATDPDVRSEEGRAAAAAPSDFGLSGGRLGWSKEAGLMEAIGRELSPAMARIRARAADRELARGSLPGGMLQAGIQQHVVTRRCAVRNPPDCVSDGAAPEPPKAVQRTPDPAHPLAAVN
jgi:hypothetical protein